MAGERKVAFTEDAAQRIAAATLAHERGNRDMPPIRFRPVSEEAEGLRIGKSPSTVWTKGTLANINIYENGTPPNESPSDSVEDVVNHWGDVMPNRWVGVMRAGNGYYYLVVAEC